MAGKMMSVRACHRSLNDNFELWNIESQGFLNLLIYPQKGGAKSINSPIYKTYFIVFQ
jgi:hypothetical protein